MKSEETKRDEHERDSSIVGHITGRVVHDFNNVLQGIIGLAEMLDADPTVPEKAKIGMKAIRRLGQNATRMVQTLGSPDEEAGLGSSDVEIVGLGEIEVPVLEEKLFILVADDDPLVLKVVTGMLRFLGYSTLAAGDGQEALELFNNNVDRIGMVITDMMMPRMGGLELAERLLSEQPETKIVVMTGYLQEEAEINPAEIGLAGWLEKPMTAERLRQVVDPIMDKAGF